MWSKSVSDVLSVKNKEKLLAFSYETCDKSLGKTWKRIVTEERSIGPEKKFHYIFRIP